KVNIFLSDEIDCCKTKTSCPCRTVNHTSPYRQIRIALRGTDIAATIDRSLTIRQDEPRPNFLAIDDATNEIASCCNAEIAASFQTNPGILIRRAWSPALEGTGCDEVATCGNRDIATGERLQNRVPS